MEEEPSKGPSHNNPKEAANYVRSVNSLLKSFVTSICGFDRYKRLDAWETFLHALSQLLSKLDSAYFIKMDTEVILDTIPDKACDAFLARPEEAATRIQLRVSSDEIPSGPEVLSKMHLQGNLPCFDKKGQQAVTRLTKIDQIKFTLLQLLYLSSNRRVCSLPLYFQLTTPARELTHRTKFVHPERHEYRKCHVSSLPEARETPKILPRKTRISETPCFFTT